MFVVPENVIPAVRTLLEAHELLAEGLGASHERTTKTVNQLITLYESWHATKTSPRKSALT